MNHRLPRNFWRYPVRGSWVEQARDLSPRQRYIAQQSILRWERRNPGAVITVALGELGTIDGIRIIQDAAP